MHRAEGTGPDFDRLAAQYADAVQQPALCLLASGLGVSIWSLQRLNVGWSASQRAWAFPMHSSRGRVLGIRLRADSGRKWAVRGGREGLFVPAGLAMHDTLLVCEGATDTAAVLELGFCAIGRPSCTGGTKLLVDLVRELEPPQVVIAADRDAAGIAGAEALAGVLCLYCRSVRTISPPPGTKDIRAWRRAGGEAGDVRAAIRLARPRRPKIERRPSH
jgi:hypothetical protein